MDVAEGNVSGQRTGPRQSTSIFSSDSSDAASTGADSVSSPPQPSTPKPAEAKPPVNGVASGLKSQLTELRRRMLELNDPERKRRVRDDLLRQVEEERQKRKAEIQELMAETKRIVEEQQRRHKENRTQEKELEVRLRHQEDTWADEIKSLYDEVMALRTAAAVRRAQANAFMSAVEAKQLEAELHGESPVPSPRQILKEEAGGELVDSTPWQTIWLENVDYGPRLDQHLRMFKSAVSQMSPSCRENLRRVREQMQQRADAPLQRGCFAHRLSDGRTEYAI